MYKYTPEQYERVVELRKQTNFGSIKLSRLIEIPKRTIAGWIYENKIPHSMIIDIEYQKQELINELRKLSSSINHPLTVRYVKEIGKDKLYSRSCRYFGSWNNAKRVIGLKILVQGKTLDKQLYKLPASSNEPTFNLGYVIGVILGDGCIYMNSRKYKYFIQLIVKDKDFAEFFAKIFEKWSKKRVSVKFIKRLEKHKKTGEKFYSPYYSVIIYSKNISIFLEDKIKLLNWIYKSTKSLKIGVIKGLWDSEGHYSSYKLGFSNYDQNVMKLFLTLTNELGITFKTIKDGRESQSRGGIKTTYNFYKIIGITIKRKRDKVEEILNKGRITGFFRL